MVDCECQTKTSIRSMKESKNMAEIWMMILIGECLELQRLLHQVMLRMALRGATSWEALEATAFHLVLKIPTPAENCHRWD